MKQLLAWWWGEQSEKAVSTHENSLLQIEGSILAPQRTLLVLCKCNLKVVLGGMQSSRIQAEAAKRCRREGNLPSLCKLAERVTDIVHRSLVQELLGDLVAGDRIRNISVH
jgi:hypothetical protein